MYHSQAQSTDLLGFYNISGYSDNGSIRGAGSSPIPIMLSATVNISGYWELTYPFSNSYSMVYFPEGQYTVVVADEWGGVELLHFRVG